MAKIYITPKGEEWALEQLRKHNIDPKILSELGQKIKAIAEEYRIDPLGTIMMARREEEFGPVNKIAERLLKELGLE